MASIRKSSVYKCIGNLRTNCLYSGFQHFWRLLATQFFGDDLRGDALPIGPKELPYQSFVHRISRRFRVHCIFLGLCGLPSRLEKRPGLERLEIDENPLLRDIVQTDVLQVQILSKNQALFEASLRGLYKL